MREQLEPIWNRVREELRREVPDFTFHIWFDPLELAGAEGATLFVRAPDHIRTWVRDRYLPVVRAAARRAHRADAIVEIVDARLAARGHLRARDEPRTGARRGLNPKYTFEQFVIGRGNRFAHAGALAVRRAARPRPTTRSSSTAGRGSARPICSTPSATTSRASEPA